MILVHDAEGNGHCRSTLQNRLGRKLEAAGCKEYTNGNRARVRNLTVSCPGSVLEVQRVVRGIDGDVKVEAVKKLKRQSQVEVPNEVCLETIAERARQRAEV